MMKRRAGIVAVACALMCVGLGQASATAAGVPCRGTALDRVRGNFMEVVKARTFHVAVETQAKTYAIGSKAKIDITVTRPAHEDPLDLGVPIDPPTSAPAEGIYVGVGIHVGQVFVPGFGLTDADGKTTISIKLPTYMKPGTASIAAYAWNVVHESPCLRVEEDGYTSVPEGFEVVPRR